MEARGFEPRSEVRFTTASTCVVHRLVSPAAGQWTAHYWTSLLNFRRPPEDATGSYPEFAILFKPPQEGFLKSRCSNSEELRSHCHVSVGSCDSSRRFYQDPSTWARGHSFTNPVEASRPRNYEANRIDTQSQRESTSTNASDYAK